MEGRVNYIIVGLFTLLLAAVAVIIPLWLTSGLEGKSYNTYAVYMNESVDGLDLNAAVKYNGVNIGHVKSIKLNPVDTEQVILLLDIEQGVPITTHTVAVLETRGLTGVSDLGLKGGSPIGAKVLLPAPGQSYPVIQSGPSLYSRLDTALSSLTSSLDSVNKHLNRVFSDKNQQALTNILNNLDIITSSIAKHHGQLEKSFDKAQRILQNFSQSSENMPETFNQLQILLDNLRATTNEIKQNPSILIRGTTQPKLGPGE
jgi:phospholipid/cholesterol/gamma-HCH transport system substrate-binding protein